MKRLVPLLFIALPTGAFAGSAEIIKAVETKYASVDTLQAGFTQTTKSELYGDDVQKGKMVVKRPSMMRWTFTQDGKEFITNGQIMSIYTPNEKQVIQYSDVSQASSSANSLLQSLDKISELFEVEVLVETEAKKQLRLQPKSSDAQVKRIELSLDKDLVVQEVSILDAFGSETQLAFTDMVLGADIDDKTFTFEVPAGVEVIKAN